MLWFFNKIISFHGHLTKTDLFLFVPIVIETIDAFSLRAPIAWCLKGLQGFPAPESSDPLAGVVFYFTLSVTSYTFSGSTPSSQER